MLLENRYILEQDNTSYYLCSSLLPIHRYSISIIIIIITMKTPKFLMVYFDSHRPEAEKAGHEQQQPPTDYSPLPRITGRSLGMGAMVSMGGLM